MQNHEKGRTTKDSGKRGFVEAPLDLWPEVRAQVMRSENPTRYYFDNAMTRFFEFRLTLFAGKNAF